MTGALTVLNSAMARLKGNTLTGTVLGVAEDREEGCQWAPPSTGPASVASGWPRQSLPWLSSFCRWGKFRSTVMR